MLRYHLYATVGDFEYRRLASLPELVSTRGGRIFEHGEEDGDRRRCLEDTWNEEHIVVYTGSDLGLHRCIWWYYGTGPKQ